MAVYQIAGLRWKIALKTPYAVRHMHDYLADGDDFDEELVITKDDILFEQSLATGSAACSVEFTAILRKVCHALLYRYDGLFLHAATLMYNGKAYAFTAPSGTGKTTHCKLWRSVLGEDKVRFLNGDKLLLRFQDGRPIAYGNPWQGKEDYGENGQCELNAIFIVQRAEENSVFPAPPSESLRQLLRATVFPNDGEGKLKLLDRLEQILNTVKIGVLNVNMDPDAVETALSFVE